MQKEFTKIYIVGTLASCALFYSGLNDAHAQYPTRPVRVIIPYSPGGSSDAVGRIVGQKLGETLKQQFVIDNRPGASGSLGREIVAKAAPDGYTLLIGDAPHTINVHVLRHVPYDPISQQLVRRVRTRASAGGFDSNLAQSRARCDERARRAQQTQQPVARHQHHEATRV